MTSHAHLAQPVTQQHHAGRVARHCGAAAHGDANIGRGQRGGVIHAIAHQGHLPPLCPQPLHNRRLLLWAHAAVGVAGVDACRSCHGLHRLLSVS